MTWQIVAHESELKEPGDFVCLPWTEDGEIAVMKNDDNTLTAFDNRCPHRGAKIFTSLRGNREPICGYHGRRALPSQVWKYPVANANGWILARLAAPDAPVSFDKWAPLILHAGLFDVPTDLAYHSTVCNFVLDCHWTVAVENALDNEHVGLVHAKTLATLGIEPVSLKLYDDGSSLEQFKAATPDSLDRAQRLFASHAPFDYMHLHCYPYVALSSSRGLTYSLQHYYPRKDGRTNFVSRLYARPGPELFLGQVAAFNRRVFVEDAEICRYVPAGHDGELSGRERRISHFRMVVNGR